MTAPGIALQILNIRHQRSDELNGLIDDVCQLFVPPVRRGGGTAVWSTQDPVTAEKPQKFVDVTLKAKRTSNEEGGFGGVVITGVWADDGDGIAEDPGSTDDEIECTGESTTSFLMKGKSPAPRNQAFGLP